MDDAWDAVDDVLTGDLPDSGEPEPLRDSDEANRTLRRIRRIRLQRDAELAAAIAERERLERYINERQAHWLEAERFHVERLVRWHAAVLRDDSSRRTISLPVGTLTARAQQAEWTWDEPTFIEWAKEHMPSALRPVPPVPPSLAIDKAAAKRLLTHGDGRARQYGVEDEYKVELPPGVKVTERDVKFDFQITEEA